MVVSQYGQFVLKRLVGQATTLSPVDNPGTPVILEMPARPQARSHSPPRLWTPVRRQFVLALHFRADAHNGRIVQNRPFDPLPTRILRVRIHRMKSIPAVPVPALDPLASAALVFAFCFADPSGLADVLSIGFDSTFVGAGIAGGNASAQLGQFNVSLDCSSALSLMAWSQLPHAKTSG